MTSAPAHRRAFAAVVVVMTVAVLPVAAQRMGPGNPARPQMVAANDSPGRGGRSLSEAIRHVQRSTGGQILGAERVPFDGRDINRVKYLDDRGRVRYMDDPGPQHAPAPAPHRTELPGSATPPHDANR